MLAAYYCLESPRLSDTTFEAGQSTNTIFQLSGHEAVGMYLMLIMAGPALDVCFRLV